MPTKLQGRSIFCGFILLLAFAGQSPAQQDRPDTLSPQADALPAEARYLILFRRLTTSPSPNQANDPSAPRAERPNYRAMFQRSARLNDDEARALNQIAGDCMQKVQELDKRASQIVAAGRAESKPGNAAPGRSVTTPPAELSQLQQDRNNAIRNAIEQIRIAFGDPEFKRFDDYVMSQGDGRRAVLPPRNAASLPIQVTITLLDHDGKTMKKQFGSNDGATMQIAMLNNSTQMIAVKESEVYDWLEITSSQNRPLPFSLLLHMSGSNGGNESPLNVPPTQLTIVGRVELGGLKLKPGTYQITVHEKVLLNRPPNDSQILELSLSEAVEFEIVP